MTFDLPEEILRDVFDFAVGNDPIASLDAWRCMAVSEWKDLTLDWHLLEPHQRIQFDQRVNYALKKALMLVCKKWSRVAVDFMYRAILVSDLKRLRTLCGVLDANNRLGWWTRTIYLFRDSRLSTAAFGKEHGELGDCISTLVRHCPHTETFLADPMLGPYVFPIIADSLRTFCEKSLSTVRWHITKKSQGLLIPSLQALQNLTMLHIRVFNAPSQDSTNTSSVLRSRTGVSFPLLEDLSLRGDVLDIVEEIPSWDLPKLTHFTLDFEHNIHDFPDVLGIIASFGIQLTVLDINSLPTQDVPHILAACPNLITFCFNIDWEQYGGCLTNLPHQNIERIGLHGLSNAFGVGYTAKLAASNPYQAIIVRRRNDNNFAAFTKRNFPKLTTVRMLSPNVLRDLNKANGPAEGVCYERWERWWEQCASQRINLEDCVGNLLGTLPDAGGSDGEDSEDGEGDEDQEPGNPSTYQMPARSGEPRLGDLYNEFGIIWDR